MTRFRVLLVDDSPLILKALVRSLRPEGYELLTAGSAHEALAMLGVGKVDAIVTDENMPGLTGTEFLRAVRERDPDTVRIMLTGDTSLEIAKKAINEGHVYRFLTKPWDDFELALALRLGLREKETASENIRLKSILKNQSEMLRRLETDHPGITQRDVTEDGSFVIES